MPLASSCGGGGAGEGEGGTLPTAALLRIGTLETRGDAGETIRGLGCSRGASWHFKNNGSSARPTCFTEGHRAVLPPSVGVHGEAVDPLPLPPRVPAVVVLAHVRFLMAVGLCGRPRLAGQVSGCGVHGAHVVLAPGGLLLTPLSWVLTCGAADGDGEAGGHEPGRALNMPDHPQMNISTTQPCLSAYIN